MARKTISMYKIFDYWKDKCITETGDVEIDYGYDGCNKEQLDLVDSIGVIEDWGEPSCFCCGAWAGTVVGDGSEYSLKELWNSKQVSSKLQKAHIVPSALGGDEAPKNMFCLCSECHKESPDTIYRQEFFKWIYNRRKNPKRRRLILDAIKQCEKEGILPLFSVNDINLHTCNTHAGSFADSTYVAGLVGAAKERADAIKCLADMK